MVEPLEGEPHTIKAWATRNNGVVSAKAEDTFMDEQDTERAMCSPYTHISSELVYLKSHHVAVCKRSSDMTGYKDNMIDAMLAIDNEVKEDKGSSFHLNIGN